MLLTEDRQRPIRENWFHELISNHSSSSGRYDVIDVLSMGRCIWSSKSNSSNTQHSLKSFSVCHIVCHYQVDIIIVQFSKSKVRLLRLGDRGCQAHCDVVIGAGGEAALAGESIDAMSRALRRFCICLGEGDSAVLLGVICRWSQREG